MIHIVLVLILAIWFVSGFLSWGFQDGYVTTKHVGLRKGKVDWLFLMFALMLGPASLLATVYVLGCKNWTRRLWSRRKKDGWEMLLKLEDSPEV